MQGAPVLVIALHAIGHDHAGIIVEVRVRHAQRFENVRLGEGAKRLAAHSAHDTGQQRIGTVVVLEFGARCEVEAPRARENFDHHIVVEHVIARRIQLVQREPVSHPARMRKQVADRDPALMVGPLGDVLSHLIVERQLAALCEEQDTHSGELFGDRSRGKDGCRRDGDP